MRRLNHRTNVLFGLLIVIAIAVSGCGRAGQSGHGAGCDSAGRRRE